MRSLAKNPGRTAALAVIVASSLLPVVPGSAHAQSALSVLIDQCSRGNMTMCQQAQQLSISKSQQRTAPGLAGHIDAAEIRQAQSSACRKSSYIPGLSPLMLRKANGTTLALKRSVRNHVPTVRVWINGQYAGEPEVPFAMDGGQIQVRLHQRMGLETWLGRVRQANKSIPYLVVCGDWSGDLP